VVISDQMMPGMKGMALFARPKSIKPRQGVILCTGFSDASTEEHAIRIGRRLRQPVPEQITNSIRNDQRGFCALSSDDLRNLDGQ
jgi:DNA-binding NtrC family response regulator